jgi:hypothetical protein
LSVFCGFFFCCFFGLSALLLIDDLLGRERSAKTRSYWECVECIAGRTKPVRKRDRAYF